MPVALGHPLYPHLAAASSGKHRVLQYSDRSPTACCVHVLHGTNQSGVSGARGQRGRNLAGFSQFLGSVFWARFGPFSIHFGPPGQLWRLLGARSILPAFFCQIIDSIRCDLIPFMDDFVFGRRPGF